ncbi:MAG: hypothetical protein K0U86_22415 [Planctomycetes bacterium]|nr:hypothetical protein [Planctomycetota bacterium]MCH9727664.1 hypothetical protein [Planctomycetota bacterium]MCH9775089.1 hypothetical protein [Planctomycetota bacterium]MCH9789593.1 hypothetical protein [Planctomycetota bacterium]
MTNLKKRLVLAVLAGIFAVTGAAPVSAGDGYQRQHQYQYQQVTTYKYQKQYKTVYITRYDHCGKPYRVKRVRCYTVKVPVTRWVKVCY